MLAWYGVTMAETLRMWLHALKMKTLQPMRRSIRRQAGTSVHTAQQSIAVLRKEKERVAYFMGLRATAVKDSPSSCTLILAFGSAP